MTERILKPDTDAARAVMTDAARAVIAAKYTLAGMFMVEHEEDGSMAVEFTAHRTVPPWSKRNPVGNYYAVINPRGEIAAVWDLTDHRPDDWKWPGA